jgi:protein kinase-like protein
MAVELLISQTPVFHKPRHDLESIFFVLVYLCSNLSGPQVPRPLSELQKLQSLPIASWFNPAFSIERLGADKISALMLINQRITPYFSEYFNDLKPCALKLYHALFPTFQSLLHPPEISHDDIIQIFDDTLKDLPAVDRIPTPSSGPSRQRKRSLGIHDNSLYFSRLKKTRTNSGAASLNSGPGIHSSTGSRSCTSSPNVLASPSPDTPKTRRRSATCSLSRE